MPTVKLFVAMLLIGCCGCARGPEFDIVITGGTVYDGAGTPQGIRRIDVGINGDHISALGDLSGRSARLAIDASNRVVAPGFIDAYGRSGTTLLVDGNGESHTRQGITTEILADAGPAFWTAATTPPADQVLLARFNVKLGTNEPLSYVEQLSARGTSVNVARLVPGSFVSTSVMADTTRSLTADELAKMQDVLETAMRAGAIGLSIDWDAPGARAFTTDELIALARIVARNGGLYVSTLRGNTPVETSIREIITIAATAGGALPFMIANLNVMPPAQKGTLAAAIAAIREADVRGVSASASVTSYSDDEADVRPALTYPRAVIGTGTAAARTEGELSQISMQPAAYGAFPRLLGEYVRNAKLLELREAIYRVTGLPAAQFRIPQRGFIREDYFADLVIFDPQTIASPATNAQPHQYPTGIDYVIVNGVQVVTPAGHTGAHPGRILPGASPRPAS